MPATFSPKQVASAIGVSEASLKRWCDRGLLTAVRTPGGHRRMPASSVFQFLRQTGHPLVRPEVLGMPASTGRGESTLERSVGHVVDALCAGDEERLRRVVLNLYLAPHAIVDICDLVLAPAFQALGDRWQHGELEVYQERRGCEICMRVLVELRWALPPPAEDAPHALGGTLSGDHYTIPTTMAEVCLREAGWRAESYGVGLPIPTFCAALTQRRPRLAWLSTSLVENPPGFIEWANQAYASATAQGIALVVGGRALTEDLRRNMRYTAFCDNMRHLVAFAQSMHRLSRVSDQDG